MQEDVKLLYFNIAGFNICIKFTPTGESILTEMDARAFYKSRFGGYVIYPPKKVDYWIEFIQQTSFEVMIKDNLRSYFINFYKNFPKKTVTFYHISFAQFQIILRNILQDLLVGKRGLFFHASASLINNKACLFLGESGAGKSTTTKLLEKSFQILADDNVILKREKNGFVFYQPPLFEKNFKIYRYKNKYRLGGFFFLRKSKNFSVTKLVAKEQITGKLIKQFLTDQESLNLQMPQLLQLVASYSKFYILELSLNHDKELIEYFLRYGQKKRGRSAKTI